MYVSGPAFSPTHPMQSHHDVREWACQRLRAQHQAQTVSEPLPEVCIQVLCRQAGELLVTDDAMGIMREGVGANSVQTGINSSGEQLGIGRGPGAGCL